jgi:hypothetical protein
MGDGADREGTEVVGAASGTGERKRERPRKTPAEEGRLNPALEPRAGAVAALGARDGPAAPAAAERGAISSGKQSGPYSLTQMQTFPFLPITRHRGDVSY